MANVFDVIGFVQDGDVFCPDCFEGDAEGEDVGVVFGDVEEFDHQCSACGEDIGDYPADQRKARQKFADLTVDLAEWKKRGREWAKKTQSVLSIDNVRDTFEHQLERLGASPDDDDAELFLRAFSHGVTEERSGDRR